ncbi:tRNA pseudouridine(38-40) synthase TruA [Bosea sp. (in: a-proteobacteria)]|uniref:tRNA pseudouridine(38-40) synthase TruA n=1 Tax=Bosea sp. (in: a-proteobacteria) TaxID=1871050 RepID=UPI003B3AECAC
MPRYKLVIEYDGTPFSGWQRQLNGPSVQQSVEEAIEAFCGHAVRLHCAGRTDAGVHATHQVAHVDLAREWRTDVVRDAANARLKSQVPVSVLSAEIVSDAFDARISARRRYYIYRILDRRAPPALDRGRVWHVPVKLDHEAMDRSAKALLGHHDFTTFRAAECQANSPLRTLDRLDVVREGAEVVVYAHARSFLHHQVRSIVGSLKMVGMGRWPEAKIGQILAARERAQCAALAPSCGLYLAGVDY